MNPSLVQLQFVYTLITNVLVIAVIVAGLRMVVTRATGAPSGLWQGLSATLLAWYALVSLLAIEGTFVATRAGLPTIPFGVLIPVVIGLAVIFRSSAAARLLDATPLHWLIGVQAYRMAGAIFLILFAAGHLPEVFAIPAGVGDILVGIFALVAARNVRLGRPGARSAAYAWNGAGLFDFVVALGTGFLSSPSPFQVFALEQPNRVISAYPLVMIPVFLVPLSILLHALCLWKLTRDSLADHGNSLNEGARPRTRRS